MSSQCFIMNVNRTKNQNLTSDNNEAKPPIPKEKVMSYEEKSVGSTAFFKCEACPFMALAEDDIKFHLFTVHPDLAKSNGLADNIQIQCPGCTSVFDAEETLRTHLRNHHKMGFKDIKKMVKSLVQIALKNAKLKKEDNKKEAMSSAPPRQEVTNVKIPQVIEIVPDMVNANSGSLPEGVAFISVDELQKMSTPNFEKIDPKEIIQGASINIVYTNEVSTQYVSVSDAVTSSTSCNVIQMSNTTPDLISSIQPRSTNLDNSNLASPPNECPIKPGRPVGSRSCVYKEKDILQKYIDVEKKFGKLCLITGCHVRLKDNEKLTYHRKCHQNGKFQCPECAKCFVEVERIHTHLWKLHAIDMELPTCEICGFKTFKKHRLYNIHMKCHGKLKSYSCSVCSKTFKNTNQLAKHRMIHKRDAVRVLCSICQLEFSCSRRLKVHVAAVHEKLKPFKCGHCDYTAAKKEELKLHIRSHTGDKPYSCNQCSYRSADHNAMRRHKRIHSKESIYKCKHCPYSSIQSTAFTSHMISKHPNVNSNDIYRCPYCRFKSVSKDKYIVHLTTHPDKEGIQLLIEMTKGVKSSKPSWTIPSKTVEKSTEGDSKTANENNNNATSSARAINTIPIEVYDCDSLSESLPQDYSKNYCPTSTGDVQQTDFNSQPIVTDLGKDDNNSDCLILERLEGVMESSDNSVLERHQYTSQHSLPNLSYENTQSNIHGYLNSSEPIEQSLLPNNVNTLTSNHSHINNNINRNNNIMSNFPIRLPHSPQISARNNITLRPVDKISPIPKVTGPIIKPTQILPVPSSSNSPINIYKETEGTPRKNAKISVKSNLILKGPDQVNMFHSQQKMAFKRLEDNERFLTRTPVTFNNLITTQFMQLPPEPVLSESPNNIMPYPQETMLSDNATTPIDTGIDNNSQIFTFNQQMNVNSMTMLPPPQKIQSNDPSYIKLEATIKQNTQSPSLERMCNVNIMNTQAMSREYKASPPLEDINKNISEIKNEVKSDTFYNIALNNTATNPSIIDQYLIDNIIGEQYSGHMDLSSSAVLPELSDDQQNDVIEIDDNSDDNKLLPRFDINFPLETLYLMNNDFHFLENDINTNNISNEVAMNEINRMVAEVPIINHKDNLNIGSSDVPNTDFTNFIQGKKDPIMNTPVRASTNKINVKNIELMKN